MINLSRPGTAHSHPHSEPVAGLGHQEKGMSISNTTLAFIHHGAGAIGLVYRILLGIGIVGMSISGSMIFFKVRAHSKKH